MRVSSVPEDLCACEDLCGGPLLSREDLWSITSIFVITTLMRSVLARAWLHEVQHGAQEGAPNNSW